MVGLLKDSMVKKSYSKVEKEKILQNLREMEARIMRKIERRMREIAESEKPECA